MAGWMRKTVAVGVAAFLLTALAACGSNGANNGNEAAQPEAAQTASNQSSAQSNSENSAGTDSQTRVVTDEFGEVTIPAHPKRVAGIYVEDYLKALGVQPVVQWYHPNWGKQDYLNLEAPLFDFTGSIEALLAEKPDLIIVDGGVDKNRYDEFSKVAPTYRLPESVLQDSKQVLKTVADVLGIPEKADAVLADYEAKVQDAKTKLKEAIGDKTVAFIRVNVGDKTIALFGAKNRYTGGILYDELGLQAPPLVRDMTEYQEVLSEEAFPSLGADYIIVIPSNGDWETKENQTAYELLDSPLWKSVPAFANGHVYKFDRTYWQSGGITANSMKIDDLLQLTQQ